MFIFCIFLAKMSDYVHEEFRLRIQSRSSQSPLFLGSYANMHVYERKKFTDPREFIKICVGDF